MTKEKEKVVNGGKFLMLALDAFLGLGLEMLLIMVEPYLYGVSPNDWTAINYCMHWGLTCVIWGSFAFTLVRVSKKKYGFDILSCREKPNSPRIVLAIILTIAGILYVNYSWEGIKVVKEFQNQGVIKFGFQYIYYIFEMVLVTLIVVFGQRFGEIVSRGKRLPFGGIVLAFTWGLVHILSKDLATGIFAFIMSMLFGVIYLLVRKNIYWTYLLLTVIFIL